MALDAVLASGYARHGHGGICRRTAPLAPRLPLIVITMRNGVEVAVGAMRAGARN